LVLVESGYKQDGLVERDEEERKRAKGIIKGK